jgi:predicted RNase H-like HicB family nuclease
MSSTFTAITKKDGDRWIGWIEEVPGVDAQEATKEELISCWREILVEALELNRSEARQAAEDNYYRRTSDSLKPRVFVCK